MSKKIINKLMHRYMCLFIKKMFIKNWMKKTIKYIYILIVKQICYERNKIDKWINKNWITMKIYIKKIKQKNL